MFTLPIVTSYAVEPVHAARIAPERLRQPGQRYNNAGVITYGLEPAGLILLALFGTSPTWAN